MAEIGRINPSEHEAVNALSLSHLSPECQQNYLNLAPGHAALFREMLNGTRGACFVARDGNKIVGYALGYPVRSELTDIRYGELDGLYVEDHYRRQNIGKRLVEAFFEWAKEHRLQRIKVVTGWPNQKDSLAFYEELGFRPMSIELELHFE